MDKKELILQIKSFVELYETTASGGLKSFDFRGLCGNVIQHLESEPFDVLQSLRDGDTLEDGMFQFKYIDDVMYEKRGNASFRISSQGDQAAVLWSLITKSCKPYVEPLPDGWYMVDVKAKGMAHDTQEMAMKRVGDYWRDGFGCKHCDTYDISNPRRIEVSDDN